MQCYCFSAINRAHEHEWLTSRSSESKSKSRHECTYLVAAAPAGHEHGDVHGGQRENEVEEGVVVGDWGEVLQGLAWTHACMSSLRSPLKNIGKHEVEEGVAVVIQGLALPLACMPTFTGLEMLASFIWMLHPWNTGGCRVSLPDQCNLYSETYHRSKASQLTDCMRACCTFGSFLHMDMITPNLHHAVMQENTET
eukprot:1159046-Pelagomonas_calceolata.AAC.1